MVINLIRLAVFFAPMKWMGSIIGGYDGLLIGAAIGNTVAWLLVTWQIKVSPKAKCLGLTLPAD